MVIFLVFFKDCFSFSLSQSNPSNDDLTHPNYHSSPPKTAIIWIGCFSVKTAKTFPFLSSMIDAFLNFLTNINSEKLLYSNSSSSVGQGEVN